MPRNITKDDLIDARNVSFHAATAITAAAIMQGLLTFANDDMSKGVVIGEETIKDQIGTTGDRWYGGCLLLAIAMAEVVDEVLQQTNEFEGCVFTYEYVEVTAAAIESYTPKTNLCAYLMQVVHPRAWYDISENWKTPSKEALAEVFGDWMAQAGFGQESPSNG